MCVADITHRIFILYDTCSSVNNIINNVNIQQIQFKQIIFEKQQKSLVHKRLIIRVILTAVEQEV